MRIPTIHTNKMAVITMAISKVIKMSITTTNTTTKGLRLLVSNLITVRVAMRKSSSSHFQRVMSLSYPQSKRLTPGP